MNSQLLDIFKTHPKIKALFLTCPLHILETLEVQQFKAKSFQLFQEEVYDATYLIVSGQVKVYLLGPNGKSVVLAIYQPGMFIGEQEAILNCPYSASIINLTDIVVIKIENNIFRKWLKHDNNFATELIYNLSQQLFTLTKNTERFSLYTALEQIGQFLLHRQQSTRHQLKNEVNTSDRNINRVLKQLMTSGIISIHEGNIKVLDSKKLKEKLESEENRRGK
ncbi:hypothetical protein CBF34_10055 [Vagococcus penaei]|uniref:Uncharacterized protein n=1 Tax=Vagococcus penaei TaxID=633807 RepID=A0A1Q2D536_9ENTE|nr:Crp/Fnr family transcriptional regulator [Vagococcus penaei]AQP53401.1 hypothetical protein BW732_03555 [Vagococcus penaei]RST98627.1 hypothetical protein CBF34_10055 [Vagococcus penaei]